MKSRLYFAALLLAALSLSVRAQQQNAACPMHEKHMGAQAKVSSPPGEGHDMHPDAMSEMNARGEHAMGFKQGKTTHHFRLLDDGGAIEVEANDSQDASSRSSVRQHLAHIAEAFSSGDFDVPMFIHDQMPPGVPVMKRLQADIKYEFEQTERGGRVRIKTANAEALAAVHAFLRFQINEHRTGDATDK